ncbi:MULTISPECIES: hypothetical protein [unclassified Pseudofrankia]|uniref:hypothetical protein n=1 Tax=unclassified Pseudofrankia TaxID=2994372 RepID=UPI0008D95227|nr:MULTISPECIES: hypothetical protein [unclassified Pseudofrankia]MDT3445301.1 hypothetical protein [Pseudofrankia sp. BMG5.37]OHV45255.1 hypothetical protein BCD48_23230 [Pseudofrankia sp. BMG5.36]
MSEQISGVVESPDDLDPAEFFNTNRDQVVLAVRITPVFGTLDLNLVMAVVDAANETGFALVREQPLRDEYLLCVFDAYEDQD